MKKRNFPLYKIFVYVALITLAISIIVPIAWVFLASLKSQLELVSGNPFDFVMVKLCGCLCEGKNG